MELTWHNRIQDHVRQHCMDPMFVQMVPMGDSEFYVLYMTNSVNADLAAAHQDPLTPEEIIMIANGAVGCKTLGSGRRERYSEFYAGIDQHLAANQVGGSGIGDALNAGQGAVAIQPVVGLSTPQQGSPA